MRRDESTEGRWQGDFDETLGPNEPRSNTLQCPQGLMGREADVTDVWVNIRRSACGTDCHGFRSGRSVKHVSHLSRGWPFEKRDQFHQAPVATYTTDPSSFISFCPAISPATLNTNVTFLQRTPLFPVIIPSCISPLQARPRTNRSCTRRVFLLTRSSSKWLEISLP